MEFDQVAALLEGIPHTRPDVGRVLYDFVCNNQPTQVLELGFAHGVSACYIAAAQSEYGGCLLTIDNRTARDRSPSIDELLQRTGLQPHVKPVFATGSYTWELMTLIMQQSKTGACVATFDFCFIDGSHAWETDGFAFFLVDKLLQPGGWLLFDDLDWSYRTSPTLSDSEFVAAMSEDERSTPQIGRVFDLLVRQHPGYEGFRVEGPLGWARKREAGVA